MVPTQFHRLLSLPEDVRASYDVSSLRHMIHAAAPCPPEIKRRMIEWWGNAIDEYYAATEGGGTLVTAEQWLAKPGTVGLPWPTSEIRIFDEAGEDVPTGDIGTVYMRMGGAEFEYFKDKDEDRGEPPGRVLHRRRRRLPRRGRLPVPLRPQVAT